MKGQKGESRMLNFVEVLRRVNVDSSDLEDLVALSSLAANFRAEFDKVNVEAPEWLDEAIRLIRREINSRNADAVEMRKKQIRSALDNLKTREDKKAELEEELKRLEARA